MKTISFLATKGGVGKSTLCSAFAVCAVNDRKSVALLDIDPQESLTKWWSRRAEPENPKLYSNADTVSDAKFVIDQLSHDWLMIDTGPGLLKTIEPAIEAADLVVVPVKPSAFDLEAIDPVLEVIRDQGKHYVMVLNEVEPRANSKMTSTARELLESDGHPVAETTVAQRTAYRSALTSGKTGPEIERDGKCAEEIEPLWAEIKRLAAKGARARG